MVLFYVVTGVDFWTMTPTATQYGVGIHGGLIEKCRGKKVEEGKSVGGAFLWNLDAIVRYRTDTKEKPDPENCDGSSIAAYADAISKGLAKPKQP